MSKVTKALAVLLIPMAAMAGPDQPLLGPVDADERGVGQADGHGDQVAAGGTADFQHSTAVNCRGPHPEKRGDGRQPVRMSLREHIALVRDQVVRRRRVVTRLSHRFGTRFFGESTDAAVYSRLYQSAKPRTVSTAGTEV